MNPLFSMITLQTPFRETIPFYIAITLFIIVLLVVIIRIYVKKIIEDKEKLAREKDLLQCLMDNIPDTICFKDKKCRYIRINRAQADFLGLKSQDEAIGKTDFDFYDNEYAQKAFHEEQKILASDVPVINKQESIIGSGNQNQWFSTTKISMKDNNGAVNGIISLSRDISDRKEAEEYLKKAKLRAEEADRLKSAFLANMSHEIRTPMNSIIGFTDFLLDVDVNKEDRTKYLQYIKNSGNTLLTLINDIIDIAKIEAGQLNIKHEHVNIRPVLKELFASAKEIKNRLGKNDIEIRLHKDNISDLYIHTDPFRFRQVMSNLIGNAIKFTDEGMIELGYNLTNNQHIDFFVRDTGVGIPRDKIDSIFDRFAQVDFGYTRNKDGAGLGLAISKKLVELLDGQLKVNSVEGEGSVFTLSLPFNEEKQVDTNARISSFDTGVEYNWTDRHILVVEDEEVNYRLVQVILEKTGVGVSRAKNGKEAVDFITNPQHKKADLILMDIQMPVMNGYDATRLIREYDNELPIIAITAYTFSKDQDKIVNVGCSDYISKPFTGKDLLKKIDSQLSIKTNV